MGGIVFLLSSVFARHFRIRKACIGKFVIRLLWLGDESDKLEWSLVGGSVYLCGHTLVSSMVSSLIWSLLFWSRCLSLVSYL